MGIAVFTVILLHIYFGRIFELLAGRDIHPTQGEMHRGREFVLRAEQKGLRQVSLPPFMRDVIRQFEDAHIYAYQLTFVIMGVMSVVGAAVCWLLVRREDHLVPAVGIFSRRSRWSWATPGAGPGLTRKPPPGASGSDRQGSRPSPDRRAE